MPRGIKKGIRISRTKVVLKQARSGRRISAAGRKFITEVNSRGERIGDAGQPAYLSICLMYQKARELAGYSGLHGRTFGIVLGLHIQAGKEGFERVTRKTQRDWPLRSC